MRRLVPYSLCGLLLVAAAGLIGCRGSVEKRTSVRQGAVAEAQARAADTTQIESNATGPAGVATTAPQEAGQESATEVLERLVERSPLRLSTDPQSAAETFSFVTHATRRSERGDRLASDVFVARSGARVGIVTASPNGLPYCYMTGGLLVTTDRANPGGLIVYPHGAPSFVLNCDEDREFINFTVTYSDDVHDPKIVLDLRSLLKSTLKTAKEAAFGEGGGYITVRTKGGAVVVELAKGDPDRAPGISGFTLSSTKSQLTLSVLRVTVDSPPPLNLFDVSEERLRRLQVPVRAVGARDIQGIDLLVPADFGKDPRERAAAQALLKLLISGQGREPPRVDPTVQKVLWIKASQNAVPHTQDSDLPHQVRTGWQRRVRD